ncbi:MAG: transglutaminase-like domain-containing protein, partial [Bacteroidia bacterium]
DPNLTALRKAFNLDSVAGTGSEVSQILNLLHWIHNLVPHNGSMENPAVKNAMSMIAVCKKEKRGLNCRGLATVLNECYLSLGIKSRFITCMPKDSLGVDNDCHVINMVYAPSLKKWLWIDPTFDAYVMNENGDLLSIEEVRERIIKNRPMILNPDANWNHQSSQTKEHYLMDYMAKNLYKLSCAVSSEYDTETNAANKTISYIDLLPLDYYMQKPDKTEHVGKTTGTTHVTYNTNNPVLFWQIPE